MEQGNRKSWVNQVAIGMAPLFARWTSPCPPACVAISFTSCGAKGKAIGECWDNRCSDDGHFEISTRPNPAHEMVHVTVGIAAGHRRAFKRIAIVLGLAGPMRATTSGAAFLARSHQS